jgi:hypothetical protein
MLAERGIRPPGTDRPVDYRPHLGMIFLYLFNSLLLVMVCVEVTTQTRYRRMHQEEEVDSLLGY